MSRPLVDTDILIDASRGTTEAIEFLKQQETQENLNISVITQMELLAGCRDKTEQREVEHFLKRFDVIPINEAASHLAVELMVRYRLSHGLQIPDALIAATALVSGYSLATKNQKHFRFIPNLKVMPYP